MSNTLVVFWDQLEFWFRKKPNGFFKFLKPCDHRWYKQGDSWCEQLRISENTFRKYQAYVCTSYQSKTAFDEQSDPFQGKPYACYMDRLRKITVYVRNHSLATQLTKEKILRAHCVSSCVWNNTDNNKNIKYPPKSPLVQQNSGGEGGGLILKKNHKTNDPTSELLDSTAQQMHQIWIEATKDHIKTPRLSVHFAQKLLEALKGFFQNSLERWKAYCEKIASSDFLMGKRGTFQAWLVWVIRGDTIQKVRAGGYGLKKEEQEPERYIVDIVKCEKKFETIINNQVQHVKDKDGILKKLKMLKDRIGSPTYVSWFADCEIAQEGQGAWLDFSQLGRFQRDYIREKFSHILKEFQLCAPS